LYNWGYNSAYGGEYVHTNLPNNSGDSFYINMVANYYKPGPATKPGEVSHRIANPSYRDSIGNYGKWYVADNYVVDNPTVTADNWNGGVQVSGGLDHIAALKLNEPWDAMPIHQESAEEAYQSVLENAGAIYPKRDKIDSRIVEEVKGGYATYEGAFYKRQQKVKDPEKKSGIIDSPIDVGGWPELKGIPAPVDSDHDGMPDAWEIAKKLDPNNPEDRNKIAPDGYTYLEKYINSLCNE
jgi:pectate lyase